MSTLETRYGTESPRTTEFPRAFTAGEFVRGAAFAWLWFQPCVAVSGAIVGATTDSGLTIGFLPIVIGLPFTVATTVLGSPIAFALGTMLRRQRHDMIHLVVFAVYGLILGCTVPLIVLGDVGATSLAVMCGAAGTVALPLGWWTTSRLGLRQDRARSAGR